jgi:NTE family protein
MCAAVYAAGYSPDEIEDYMLQLDQKSFFGSWPASGPALLGVSTIKASLQELVEKRTFADLRIPCAVIAVDVDGYQEVILKDGPVIDALMATIALPGIFPPLIWGENRLVDGGLMDPVPVAVARFLAPGLPVAAVVLTPPLEARADLASPRLFKTPQVLEHFTTRLRVAQSFDIFMRSVDIGGRMLSELHLRLDQPEVIIRPKVGHINILDRVDVSEVVKLGEAAAIAALPQLRQAVSLWGKIQRRLNRRGRQ